MAKTFFAIINSHRPFHWMKNALVFTPAFFSGRAADGDALALSAAVFAVFCAAASAMYLLNDVADRKPDRLHSRKRRRPLASGRVRVRHHFEGALVMGAVALIGAALTGRGVFAIVVSYLCIGFVYSFLLKKIYGLNFAAIGAGMLLRVMAGAAVLEVRVSPWVYPSVLTLSVFVAVGKRVFDSEGVAGAKTRVAFVGAGVTTFATYLAYSVFLTGANRYDSRLPALTAAPVLAGLIGYYRLVVRGGSSREHFAATAADPVIAASVLVWLALFTMLIYG